MSIACKNVVLFFSIIFTISANSFVNQMTLQEKKEHYRSLAMEKSKNNFSTSTIKGDDYTWEYTFDDLEPLYNELYESGRRLPHPIHYDDMTSQFMLPVNDTLSIAVPWDFIFAVTRHIEEALEKGMADYVFLADMGHGHFYLPDTSRLFSLPYDKKFEQHVFTEIVQSPNTKILYHTAEMFLFMGKQEDFNSLSEHEQYRNKTRNLVGEFTVSESMTRYIPYKFGEPVVYNIGSGYKKLAQDIDISASRNGAFPFMYKGKIHYFDISRFSPDQEDRVLTSADELF